MPDDIRYNATHATMGLLPTESSSVGFLTPSPAQTSIQLNQEAQARATHSDMVLARARSLSNNMSVGVQFQQQMRLIQQQQSMNPYAAQALSASMPGSSSYEQGMLPSPLTMTPASTGVFRPQVQAPNIAPLPPIYLPRNQWSPMTPTLPQPMFRTPYEQQQILRDAAENRAFSYAAQVPGAVGTGMGYAAGTGLGAVGGAALGSRIGRRFGGAGALIGAVGGAALAGLSGVTRGLGELFQMPMKPFIETRQMGAAIQTASQDWVVSGSQLHGLGRGLSRDASIDLAGNIKDLSEDQSFQEQTGEMFNRTDLMQILQKGGREGLFDMAQNVPQIKSQLRTTAITIKKFMELTNDPDLTSVVREMGRLRQYGLTQQEMVTAAQGMRTYAKAAGTTLEGVQAAGGLPGAMTFQQAGLSAGTGFQYGNYAAAAARQMVASGSVSPRQLALLGGIQGMAQRDIQAQAAFSSMPLFAASNATYGAAGWGVNQANLGQVQGGAFGMVSNALQAMNQGVRRGGIGALAMFPLQQRELADRAAAEMTPEQLMAQRFQMAQQTGERLGLQGKAAFAAGSRSLYGDEVAEQMLYQVQRPEFFRAQRQVVRRRQRELAFEQRRKEMEDAPIMGGIPRDFARVTGLSTVARETGRALGRVSEGFEVVGKAAGRAYSAVSDAFEDRRLRKEEGIYRARFGSDIGSIAEGMRRGSRRKDAFVGAIDATRQRGDALSGIDIGVSSGALLQAANLKSEGGVGTAARVADYASAPLMLLGDVFGFDAEVGAMASWVGVNLANDSNAQREMTRKYMRAAMTHIGDINRAKKIGGVKKNVSNASLALSSELGEEGTGVGYTVLRVAGNKLDKIVYDRGKYGKAVTDEDHKEALIDAVVETSGGSISKDRAAEIAASMLSKPDVSSNLKSQMIHYARKDSRDTSMWQTTQEENINTATYDQIAQATERRVDALREDQESLEETLGVDPWFGMYSSEEEEIQKIAAELGGKGFAVAAATARAYTGDDRSSKQLIELQKKHKLSFEQMRQMEKQVSGLSEDAQERLAEMAGRGSIAQLEEYATGVQRVGFQTAVAGSEFLASYGKYSPEMMDYVQGLDETQEELTATGIARRFTEESLERMQRTGGDRGRRMAALIRGAKTDAGKAQELEKIIASSQRITQEGVVDTATTTAGGKEGRRLAASEEALTSMESMAEDFAPAVKDFSEGAKLFLEVVETQRLRQLNDD